MPARAVLRSGVVAGDFNEDGRQDLVIASRDSDAMELFSGCGDGMCNGRPPCCYTDSDSLLGRLFGGLCEEICCVDPCYEPRWVDVGNAAFFQDGPRPVTTTRIRPGSLSRGRTLRVPQVAVQQSGSRGHWSSARARA